jgi:heme-degrading monooxygenase HmoA
MSSPAYQPFLDKLDQEILAGDPILFHVQLPPSSASDAENPLHAPVTECISAYLAPDYSQSQYTEQFTSFKNEASQVPGVEATGLTGGWSVEDHKFQEDGDEGKMFATFVGWPSVDAHMNFRKTEEFKSVIGYVREGTRGLKMWHVEFKQFK